MNNYTEREEKPENEVLNFTRLDSRIHIWKPVEQIKKEIESGIIKGKRLLYLSDGKNISNISILPGHIKFGNEIPEWATHVAMIK